MGLRTRTLTCLVCSSVLSAVTEGTPCAGAQREYERRLGNVAGVAGTLLCARG
jgi:hypothetical protein